MQFDTLLNHIGQFGTFQKLVILWIYLGGSLDGYHYGISVFILPDHKHRYHLIYLCLLWKQDWAQSVGEVN